MTRYGWLVGFALIATPAMAQHTDAEAKKAVDSFADNYVRLFNTKDAKAIAALYADNGVEVPPAPMVTGAKNIEAWFESVFKAGGRDLKYDIKQVHSLGDAEVYAVGEFSVTLPKSPGSSDSHTIHGNFVNIYQWSNDSLKYLVHSYNFMPPSP